VPIIRIEMWEGRTLDQKRELVAVLSRETARIAGCSLDSISVVIEDVKKENWGSGGQLCSEKYPETIPPVISPA
jgi:4-oxalocrotonate tautomerase